MPNEITPPQNIDPAANNAEVARQQAAQDLSGQSTVTGEFGEASDALDKLAAQVQPKEEAPPPKPEAKPEAKPDVTVPNPEPIKPAALTAEEAAVQKRASEFFKDSPTLPPNASPKSAEAFSTIKIRAAQEISARETEIAALKKQIEDAKNPSTEQLTKEKELDDLRQWRQKLDVDFDPKFKEFDKGISQSREFIYAQLSKSPAITPAVIAQIKKYGGPDMVNLSKLFESINDPTMQRLVESKVADIEMSKYNREQAVTTAKTNLGQYLQERQTALSQEQIVSVTQTATKLDSLLGQFDWFKEKTAEAGADEATKKTIQDDNRFVTDLRQQIGEAMKDNSPDMRAILITGMAKLFYLQKQIPGLEARLATAEQAAKDATAKWAAVKNSGRSRLAESQAPAGGIPDLGNKGPDLHQRAGDALDALARQVMEKRAATNT